jgi:hypothetical protein
LVEEVQKVAPRTFYSKSAGLTITVTHPKPVMEDGMLKKVGGKQAQFLEQGDKFGKYTTDDPEIIARLEQHPMVLSPEEYNKATTPADKLLEHEVAANQRLVSDNNRLLQRLAELEAQASDRLQQGASKSPAK